MPRRRFIRTNSVVRLDGAGSSVLRQRKSAAWWITLDEAIQQQRLDVQRKRKEFRDRLAGLVAVWMWALERQGIDPITEYARGEWTDDDDRAAVVKQGRTDFGIRDYTYLRRLRLKSGFYALCFCQKAASVGYRILGLEEPYLRLRETLLPPDIFRGDFWKTRSDAYPWGERWKPAPEDAQEQANDNRQWSRAWGGETKYLILPAKPHADLRKGTGDLQRQWESYWNLT